jgi:hypothetical protein
MEETKILIIKSDSDYGFLMFLNFHKNVKAKDVINNLEKYKPTEEQYEEGDWEFEVETLPGKIPIQAVAFFRSLMDEDHSKDTNFFHEDEIITD